MKAYSFFIAIAFVLCSCSGSKTVTEQDINNLNNVQELLGTKQFSLEAQWAYPLTIGSLSQLTNAGLIGNGNTAGSINLQGNPNFMHIKNDSIHMYLPYYGERRVGGGYNSNSAVEAKNVMRNYEIKDHSKKNAKVITFDVSQQTETYNVTITTFSNKSSSIVVNSNQRASIRYKGTVGTTSEL